ncbi:MAG: hypothetical protein WA971_01495, partial [Microbacterium sp.]
DEYDTTQAMFESVYPMVTVGAACKALFGVGFETAPVLEGGTTEFGTSNDRSLTAVVASAADETAATSLYTMLEAAVAECVKDPKVTFQGDPVEATVEQTASNATGVDAADGVRLTATISGVTTHVVGEFARTGNDVIAVVGWDPATNDANVPTATQMFVDRVSAATGD